MSSSRVFKYAINDDNSEDSSSATLPEASLTPGQTRKEIRTLEHVAPLCKEWYAQASILRDLSQTAVVEMSSQEHEGNRSASKKGEKAPEDSLWERSEFVVRGLVEEGKLSLVLQLYVECCPKIDELGSEDKQASIAESLQLESSQVVEEAKEMRDSLARILLCSFRNPEALQIVDHNTVMAHTALTLSHPEGRDPNDLNTGLGLLLHVMRGLDDLPEDNIMRLFQEHQVMEAILCYMHYIHNHCSHKDGRGQGDMMQAAEIISSSLETESFKATPDRFLSSEQAAGLEQIFKDRIKPLLVNYQQKKRVRQLSDWVVVQGIRK
eukprot:gb/GECH01009307.1/.p1 GENE.gb/GECH01009307.1/~~gb/GECH01009307.1/.p1  ORF type:complete len:323 (+),score=54.66 gb/GECH01009307.1/:1-969(+)